MNNKELKELIVDALDVAENNGDPMKFIDSLSEEAKSIFTLISFFAQRLVKNKMEDLMAGIIGIKHGDDKMKSFVGSQMEGLNLDPKLCMAFLVVVGINPLAVHPAALQSFKNFMGDMLKDTPEEEEEEPRPKPQPKRRRNKKESPKETPSKEKSALEQELENFLEESKKLKE